MVPLDTLFKEVMCQVCLDCIKFDQIENHACSGSRHYTSYLELPMQMVTLDDSISLSKVQAQLIKLSNAIEKRFDQLTQPPLNAN